MLERRDTAILAMILQPHFTSFLSHRNVSTTFL
jgi:hypothetical protein